MDLTEAAGGLSGVAAIIVVLGLIAFVNAIVSLWVYYS